MEVAVSVVQGRYGTAPVPYTHLMLPTNREAEITAAAASLKKKIATIQSGMLHTPFNENSKAHIHFKKDLETKISEIKEQLPWATFL